MMVWDLTEFHKSKQRYKKDVTITHELLKKQSMAF